MAEIISLQGKPFITEVSSQPEVKPPQEKPNPVALVLEAAKAEPLTDILVIGIDNKDRVTFYSTVENFPLNLWLLEMAKAQVLQPKVMFPREEN